ncbi:hypothetical protein KUTeg_022466, partial [Tegillarca granosa]
MKVLPESVCSLQSLRTLDISENQIKVLPKKLCIFNFVFVDICNEGTEAIMKFLCSECGVEYQPPSNFLLEVLPADMSPSPTFESLSKALAEEENLMKSLKNYSKQMEKKQQDRIELERHLLEEMEQQAQLAAFAAEQKVKWLEDLAKDQNKIDRELEELSHKKEEERQKMVECIRQSKIEKEEWFVVRWEELHNIRKQEVLAAMESILQESEQFEHEEALSYNQVEGALYRKQVNENVMMDILQKQEELQRGAFEALQLQKDTKNQRITQQIALIQDELASLTAVERQKKDLKLDQEINLLAEKRIDLTAMLTQLMEEQELRKAELRERLDEMEQQREDGQKDYWLVQYQRLMDRKPQSLIDQERQLELSVIGILENASAQDYIPMGIFELGVRKSILKSVEQFRFTDDGKLANGDQGASDSPEPSAPPPDISPLRQISVTARGLNSECVICMDNQSGVVFLNCGHVCTCINCSVKVQQCPLCRADITQKIKLICVLCYTQIDYADTMYSLP